MRKIFSHEFTPWWAVWNPIYYTQHVTMALTESIQPYLRCYCRSYKTYTPTTITRPVVSHTVVPHTFFLAPSAAMLSADCRLPLLAPPSESAVLPSTDTAAAAEKGWGLAGATNASAWIDNTAEPRARAPHAARFAICVRT